MAGDSALNVPSVRQPLDTFFSLYYSAITSTALIGRFNVLDTAKPIYPRISKPSHTLHRKVEMDEV